MSLAKRQLVSEEEFLSLPESMTKTELIDGEVIVSPSPTFWHQEVLRRILFELERWHGRAHDKPITLGQSPLDVRFGPDRILQPDAFVLLAAVDRDHRGPIEQIPEVCIEVLSTNRVYDRVTKRLLYAAAGVRELWLVEESGMIERWTGDALSSSEEITDTLTSPLLPGFALDVTQLFAD